MDKFVKIDGPITESMMAQLREAHRKARLHGPLEASLENPTLAICLRNIVASNQANPRRWYDISTDGSTVFISNVRRRSPAVDIKRRAAGDTDEGAAK